MGLPKEPTPTAQVVSPLHRENLQTISLLAMIGGWVLLIGYIIGYITTGNDQFIGLIFLQTLFAVLLTLASGLQRRGRHIASITALYTSVLITLIIFNLLVEGMGLALGIAIVMIFTTIAWQIMPSRAAAITSGLTIIGSVLIYLADALWASGNRLNPGIFLQEFILILAGLILFILLINAIRGIAFPSISTQIRVSFMVIAFIPLFIISIYQIFSLTSSLTSQANSFLLVQANNIAKNLDSQLFTVLRYIEEDAVRSDVVNYLKQPTKDNAILVALAARYPMVLSYGLLDKDGFLLLDNQGETGGKESEQAYFKNAAIIRITYLSDVLLDKNTGKSIIYASTPVYDEQGRLLGIIRIKFGTQLLQTTAEDAVREITGATPSESSSFVAPIIKRLAGREEEEAPITISVIDDANIILAHNSSPELVGTLLASPGASALKDLQQIGRLSQTPKILNLEKLAQLLKNSDSQPLFNSAVFPDDPDEDHLAAISMKAKPWKVIVAQDAIIFLTPMYNSLFTQSLILLSVMAAVYFGSNLTSSLLVKPVNALAAAAKQFGEGRLDAPVDLSRKDELGTLGHALEKTSRQVSELLRTLEDKVSERTGELARVNEKNQRRAAQLETIALVARAVTSLKDPNELLPEITQQISTSFGYYHVGIFLNDENKEYAVLRASNSEGGKRMLQRGHQLKIGRQGIVGSVTNSGQYRTALDVGDDAVFFNNPDLPLTRSEIALPLKIGEEIIGALDVQSIEPDAFSEDDIKSLSLLSDQISVAIENARLFAEIRNALTQVQQTYAETSTAGWQAMLTESSMTGYRFARGGVEPLHKKSDLGSLRSAETLEVPIILRGEKLGTLKIRRPGRQSAWSESETRMYQAIVERMSFALENARLFSDARRRANLERRTAEATARISSTVQLETILRTAAEEISHILDGSEVLVQIQPESIDKLEHK